mmetsp:Transcript_62237/g.148513  ORF Transcript_62237/g.148513 Transcript_62237/m.148513 type:complete len:761 (+) Transcript_62237:203-2485(+)
MSDSSPLQQKALGIGNVVGLLLSDQAAPIRDQHVAERDVGLQVQRAQAYEVQAQEYVDVNEKRLSMGMRVLWRGIHAGEIRYIGKLKGKEGLWVGLLLDEPVGRNNGIVDGVQYFSKCGQNHGMFVRPKACLAITQAPSGWSRILSFLVTRMSRTKEELPVKITSNTAFGHADIKKVWAFSIWRRLHKVTMWHAGNVWQISVDDSDPVQMVHNRIMAFSATTYSHDFKLPGKFDFEVQGSLHMRWMQDVLKWHYSLVVNNVAVPYAWTQKEGSLGLTPPEVVCRAAFHFRVRGHLHQVEVGEYDGLHWALIHNGTLVTSLEHMSAEDLIGGFAAQSLAEGAGINYTLPFDVQVKPYNVETHCHVKIHWGHTTQTWQYLVYAGSSWVSPFWACDFQLDFDPPEEVMDYTVCFKFKCHTRDGQEKLNIVEVLDSKGLWTVKYNEEVLREVTNIFKHESCTLDMMFPLPPGQDSDDVVEAAGQLECKMVRGTWEFSLSVNDRYVPTCWTWEDETQIPYVTEPPSEQLGMNWLRDPAASTSSQLSSILRSRAVNEAGTGSVGLRSVLAGHRRCEVGPQGLPPPPRLTTTGPAMLYSVTTDHDMTGDVGISEGVLNQDTALQLSKLAKEVNMTPGAPVRSTATRSTPATSAPQAEVPNTVRPDTQPLLPVPTTQRAAKAKAKRRATSSKAPSATDGQKHSSKEAPLRTAQESPISAGLAKVQSPISSEQQQADVAPVAVEEEKAAADFLLRAMKSHAGASGKPPT